ncbi:MAG: hypothetical protein DDT37_01395 [Firmicutes bacterium]|nr:hypothetical protein [candidate division NPL-UPA2 bacterium]
MLALMSASVILTGCWDAIPVERRAFVTALGVDWLPEPPHLNVTIVHPLVEERRARENRVLTIRADSVSEAFALWNHTHGQHLSLGMIPAGRAAHHHLRVYYTYDDTGAGCHHRCRTPHRHT